MRKSGLPAIADADTRIFVLGSLPGDKSLHDQRYYAHHTNQFWKLIGAVAGEELQALDYPSRLDRLRMRGIGLWDVISAAERPGSADSGIRNAAHNPIGGLKAKHPRLEAVAFNGGAAAKAGRRLLAQAEGLALYDLVSSSGLAGIPFPEKVRRWSVIARHLK